MTSLAEAAQVKGVCDPRFESSREVLQASIDSGDDVGASFAVTLDGETVVDLWGGHADAARTKPWASDTIVCVFSTTKTMTALCALVLADRGELDFSAPVSTYWPEFAQNGKEGVLVSHVLAHSAGLPGWDEPMWLEDLYDWTKATQLLAAQRPWWEPGTATGYHAISRGYLVGEVVRRITGKTLGEFFRNEVAAALGADFHIELPAPEDIRVAELIPPSPGYVIGQDAEAGSLKERAYANPMLPLIEVESDAWRRAEIPSSNGHGNARSIARIMGVLANGGTMEAARILSEAGCRRVLEEQIEGTDLVSGQPVRHGMGMGLSSEAAPLGPGACYWPGFGGSVALADLGARVSIAYAMNKLVVPPPMDVRRLNLVQAVLSAL